LIHPLRREGKVFSGRDDKSEGLGEEVGKKQIPRAVSYRPAAAGRATMTVAEVVHAAAVIALFFVGPENLGLATQNIKI
jgi:hypothetical protein